MVGDSSKEAKLVSFFPREEGYYENGSGHGTVAVLLPGFSYQLIAKPGNKTAAVS